MFPYQIDALKNLTNEELINDYDAMVSEQRYIQNRYGYHSREHAHAVRKVAPIVREMKRRKMGNWKYRS